jgi:hypothetical protein
VFSQPLILGELGRDREYRKEGGMVINMPFYTHNKTKLGVKPTGIPPYYAPDLVTDSILYAAENPVRDYIVF